ncbi:thiamine-phosphate kinase [Myxococcota bacterium]|nr:thiamine-phosphate kinase [Myxococcota bacterium]
MKLRDLGEQGLIERVRRAAQRAAAGSAPAVVLGIGDDAAILRPRSGEEVVVSTDAFVENVHFRWRTQSARCAGRRALVASLSDLAAMGARPLGFTWALAAPADLAVKHLDGLTSGLLFEAARHGCPLVGGNVSRAGETSLTFTVIGAVVRGRALRRGRARDGDGLYVTGTLGGAALDVRRAEAGLGRVRHVATPRLEAGRALARLRGMGACLDLSDGLTRDAAHLLEGTQLRASIDADAIPRPPGFEARCGRAGLDARALLLDGGEDYELLFSLRPGAPSEAVLGRRLGVRVTRIGRVVGGRPAASTGGFEHF